MLYPSPSAMSSSIFQVFEVNKKGSLKNSKGRPVGFYAQDEWFSSWKKGVDFEFFLVENKRLPWIRHDGAFDKQAGAGGTGAVQSLDLVPLDYLISSLLTVWKMHLTLQELINFPELNSRFLLILLYSNYCMQKLILHDFLIVFASTYSILILRFLIGFILKNFNFHSWVVFSTYLFTVGRYKYLLKYL